MCDWLKKMICGDQKELEEIKEENNRLLLENESLNQQIMELNAQIDDLEKQLPIPNPKESFWNTKYPQTKITYQGRWLKNYGMMPMDLRGFFQNEVSKEFSDIAENWKGLPDDEKAIECQKWVRNNIQYVSDKTLFGLDEFWELPQETLKTRKGDCDDGAILMANLMMSIGVPYWKIRLCAATVYNQNGQEMGGHCFLTYLYENPNGDDKWVAMDWCFYPDTRPLAERDDYKDSILYGKGKTWFSWNSKYSFYKFTVDSGENSYFENFKIV